MSKAIVKLRQAGNSFAVSISPEAAQVAGMKLGDQLLVNASKANIIIKKI